jgi:hypothetical protein
MNVNLYPPVSFYKGSVPVLSLQGVFCVNEPNYYVHSVTY